MARRNQGVSVPVPRVKVIKALEQALIKLETNYKNQETNEAKYKIAQERWCKEVIKLAITKVSKAENIKANVRYNNTVNIDFDLPAGTIRLPEEPTREFETLAHWQYEQNKEEIENAIRVLKMCEQETINTATYGGITKYL
jgi:hypothetical protein